MYGYVYYSSNIVYCIIRKANKKNLPVEKKLEHVVI